MHSLSLWTRSWTDIYDIRSRRYKKCRYQWKNNHQIYKELANTNVLHISGNLVADNRRSLINSRTSWTTRFGALERNNSQYVIPSELPLYTVPGILNAEAIKIILWILSFCFPRFCDTRDRSCYDSVFKCQMCAVPLFLDVHKFFNATLEFHTLTHFFSVIILLFHETESTDRQSSLASIYYSTALWLLPHP